MVPSRDGDELTSGWRQVKGNAAASPSPLVVITLWIVSLAALLVAWAIWQQSRTAAPTPATDSPPTSAPASSERRSDATFPPEIIAAANAISDAFQPTPSPTATYARLPTPRTLVCETEGRIGEACTWAEPTPTATTGPPVCVTPEPGDECLWRGRMTPTPAVPAWPASVRR